MLVGAVIERPGSAQPLRQLPAAGFPLAVGGRRPKSAVQPLGSKMFESPRSRVPTGDSAVVRTEEKALGEETQWFDEDGRRVMSRTIAIAKVSSAWRKMELSHSVDTAARLVDQFSHTELFNLSDETFGMQFVDVLQLLRSEFSSQVNCACRTMRGILVRRDIVTSFVAYHANHGDLWRSQFVPLFALFHQLAQSVEFSAWRDPAFALSVALMELCATTLPPELPTVLLWGCQKAQGQTTRAAFIQLTLAFLTCSADKCAAVSMWQTPSLAFEVPVPPLIQSLRPQGSFEKCREQCRAKLDYLLQQMSASEESKPNAPYSFSSYDQFALFCRWSRADAFLSDTAFTTILVEAVVRAWTCGPSVSDVMLSFGEICADTIASLLLGSCHDRAAQLHDQVMMHIWPTMLKGNWDSWARRESFVSSCLLVIAQTCRSSTDEACTLGPDDILRMGMPVVRDGPPAVVLWWSRIMRLTSLKPAAAASLEGCGDLLEAIAQRYCLERSSSLLRPELLLLQTALLTCLLASRCADNACARPLWLAVMSEAQSHETVQSCPVELLEGVVGLLERQALVTPCAAIGPLGAVVRKWADGALSESSELSARSPMSDWHSWRRVCALVRLTLAAGETGHMRQLKEVLDVEAFKGSVERGGPSVRDGLFAWVSHRWKRQLLLQWVAQGFATEDIKSIQTSAACLGLVELSESLVLLEELLLALLQAPGDLLTAESARPAAHFLASILHAHLVGTLHLERLPVEWPFVTLSLLEGDLLHCWMGVLRHAEAATCLAIVNMSTIPPATKLLHLLNLACAGQAGRWASGQEPEPEDESMSAIFCELLVTVVADALRTDSMSSLLSGLGGRTPTAEGGVVSERSGRSGLLDFVDSLLDSCLNLEVNEEVSGVVLNVLVLPQKEATVPSKVWRELSALRLAHLLEVPRALAQRLARLGIETALCGGLSNRDLSAALTAISSIRAVQDQLVFGVRMVIIRLVVHIFCFEGGPVGEISGEKAQLLGRVFGTSGSPLWVGWAVVWLAGALFTGGALTPASLFAAAFPDLLEVGPCGSHSSVTASGVLKLLSDAGAALLQLQLDAGGARLSLGALLQAQLPGAASVAVLLWQSS